MKKGIKRILIVILSLACITATFTGFFAFASEGGTSTETANVYMDVGAYVKVTGESKTGLRFTTKIKKNFYDEAVTEYGADSVSCGTIIVPTDYVTAADGYTFDKLTAYAEANGKEIGVVKSSGFNNASTAETDGYYRFYGSIVSILERNYTRKFSGIGYMAVEKTDGAIEYTYADYTPENQSRSVYEVVKGVYSDQDNDTKDLIKGYLDAVIDVTKNASGVGITEIDGYTSPYTLTEQTDKKEIGFLTECKSYKVNGAASAKAYVLNGVVQTYTAGSDVSIAGEETAITVPDNFKNIEHNRATATYTAGKDYIDVTLKTNVGTWTNGNDAITTYPTDMSYVAINGSDFGINDLISVDFDGNYMPVLGLYANDNLKTLVGNDTDNGYVLFNGATRWVAEKNQNYDIWQDAGKGNYSRQRLYVFGPKRVQDKVGNGNTDLMYREIKSSYGAASLDKNKSYRLIAGLIENETGKVDLLCYLFERGENDALTFVAKTYDLYYNKLTNDSASEFTQTGKLVVYGAMKDGNTTVRFTNKAAAYETSSVDAVTYDATAKTQTINVTGAKGYFIDGAFKKNTENVITVQEDTYLSFYAVTDGGITKYTHVGKYAVHNGTVNYETKNVTLTGGGVKSGSYTDISAFDNSYFAMTEQFGLGTGVDFYFTGNNMPQLCFFADTLSGNMTDGGGRGLLLMNGLSKTDGSYVPLYNEGYDANGWYIIAGMNKLDNKSQHCYAGSRDKLLDSTFTANVLEVGVNYKYTVLLVDNTQNNTWYVVLKLFTIENGSETQVGSSQWINLGDTGTINVETVANMRNISGYIVCYAGVKGTGNDTTFTYSNPYQVNKDGQKINNN